MRHPIKINLELIENWVLNVQINNERQRHFVEITKKSLHALREKNDGDIVIDVEDDVVLYRYRDGQEIVPEEEIQLYYAQCVALGLLGWAAVC